MRRYVISGAPKPLKSNWPDLIAPTPDHMKAWRYRVFSKSGAMIYESKSLDAAYDYMQLMATRTNKLYLKKYEPTPEALHDERARDKAEWRWSHGFGA